MRYTRTAIGLLNSQYRSVLKKCLLINLGLFALGAVSAEAATIEPTRGNEAPFEYIEGSASNYTFVNYVADAEGTITPEYYLVNLLPAKFSTSDSIAWALSTKTAESAVVWHDENNTATGTIKVSLPHNGDAENPQNLFYDYTYTMPSEYTKTTTRVTDITADNVNNKVFVGIRVGAIYNTVDKSSINILADFIGNYASGGQASGGAIYNSGTIGDIDGDFIGNYAKSIGTSSYISALGGAIYNDSTIGNITGDFIDNYASGNRYAYGGAIYNKGINAKIGDITGDFIGNYAYSTSSYAYGGAIDNNNGIIGNITGDFIGNEVTSQSSDALGGAVYSVNGSSYVKSITGDFIENKIIAGRIGRGGAVYNASSAQMCGIKGDFIGNTVVSETSYALGGAIFNSGVIESITGNFTNNSVSGKNSVFGGAIDAYNGATTTLLATGDKDIRFYNNRTIKDGVETYNDIHQRGSNSATKITTLNLNVDSGRKITFGGSITGQFDQISLKNTGVININQDAEHQGGTYNFNNLVQGNSIALYNNAQVVLGSQGQEDGTTSYGLFDLGHIYTRDWGNPTLETTESQDMNLTFTNDSNGGYVDARNANYDQAHHLGLMTLASTLDYGLDIDATAKTADTLTVDNDSTGTINITDIAFKDDVSQFDGQIRIIYNSNANTILTLSDELKEQYKYTKDVTRTGSKDLTKDVQFDEKFGAWEQAGVADYQLGVVGSADGLQDSLAYEKTGETWGDVTFVDEGDTLALINQADQFSDKTFNFVRAEDEYTSTFDVGTTSGNLTIHGVADGDKKSTIDLDGHSGFEIGADASLTVKGTKLTDSADGAEIDNSGALSLENAELEVALNNNNAVTTSGDTVIARDITGNGTIDNSGSLTLRNLVNDNAISGSGMTIVDGEVTTNADITTDLTVEAAGVLNMSAGVNSGETIYNSGIINLLGNNTVGTIDGTGITNVMGDMDMGDTVVIGDTVVANDGKLTVKAANLDKSASLEAMDSSTVEIAQEQIGVTKAKFAKGSTLDLKVLSDGHGQIAADEIEIEEGATLKATLGQGLTTVGKTKTVQLLSANNTDFNNFTDIADNNMYHFEKADANGAYNISLVKTAEDVANENGGTKTNQEAAKAWVDGEAFSGGIGGKVADGLADLAQNDGKGFLKALTAVAPNDAPVVQTVAGYQEDILFRTVASHLRNDSNAGIASGDLGDGLSLWARAYMGKSKLDDRADIYGFDFDSKGVIAALEKKFTPSLKAGIGYHYDEADVDAYHRDTDIDTNSLFAYGEYKPNAWFVHGTASYAMSDYDDDKHALGNTFKARYSIDTYAAQLLTGYELQYVTPEAGLRYYRIKRHGYNDSAAQAVSGKDMDMLTAVAGARFGKDYTLANHTVRPEGYVGVTYDLVSDRDNAIVGLSNGASYAVYGKRLNRFGVEAGAGLTAELTDKLSANISYLGTFRKDYQSHTGILGLKYAF